MGRAAVTLALILVGLFVLAPIGAMLYESVTADVVVTTDGERLLGRIQSRAADGVTIQAIGEPAPRRIPPERTTSTGTTFTLAHYARVLTGPGEGRMFTATLALAGAATLLAFLLGLPLGVLVGATDLPARRWIELFAVLPLVLPPILFAIATYHDLVRMEPGFLRAVIVFGLSLFPLVTLLTIRALRALDAEALNAARLQTTPREALFRIALGPALPGAAAGALLVFAFVVADFAVPDFLGVTTAKNTITVYANAVFRYWNVPGDAGAATAAGMPPTLLALAAFALVLRVESRRGAATLGSAQKEPEPLRLGRARWPALAAVVVLLAAALAWPAAGHARTASGARFGEPVAAGGARPQIVDDARARPESLWDGLQKGVQANRVDESTGNSLLMGGGGALVAVAIAIVLAEAGRRRRNLDRFLLVAAFLPIAVPPMSLAVAWTSLFGGLTSTKLFPVLLLGARLLPFAAFAVRSARRAISDDLVDAAAAAGLPPAARTARVVLPLLAPGAAVGLLLAFLFGLREVDAIIFTRTGAETLPVQLYNMIHFGFDVQVAALSLLWTGAIVLFLLVLRLLLGSSFRLLP